MHCSHLPVLGYIQAETEGPSSCGDSITLAHSQLLHMREPVGFSLQKWNLLSCFASSVYYSEKQNSQELFGTFKNSRQPAVNDPESKGGHSEKICCSTHPSYFEHPYSSRQTISGSSLRNIGTPLGCVTHTTESISCIVPSERFTWIKAKQQRFPEHHSCAGKTMMVRPSPATRKESPGRAQACEKLNCNATSSSTFPKPCSYFLKVFSCLHSAVPSPRTA